MKAVHVLSTGAYLPGDPIDNEQLEAILGPLPPEVLEGIQVQQRHWMTDPSTGEHREHNAEMAHRAARVALERADVDPSEVDLLVLSTASPEYPLPPMVTFVQDKLGLRACATLEIRSGCAGAVEAFEVASMYLERGRYRTAVVIGAEAISPILAPLHVGRPPGAMRMRDRIGAYTFGDGAGAIVLRAGEGETSLAGSVIGCVGGGRPPGMQIIGGGTDVSAAEQLTRKRLVDLRVDVTASARWTPGVITEALTDLFARSPVLPGDVDHCILPEGNAGYLRDEMDDAGDLGEAWHHLDKRVIENLSLVGATGSAAVPLALDHAWVTAQLEAGDMVLLLAIESSKWKYGASLFRWTAAPLRSSPSAVVP